MKKINELPFALLFICAVGVVLKSGVVGGNGGRNTRRCNVDEPHPITGVAPADDGGDAVLDDASILLIQQYKVASMVAELAERNE